VIAFSSDAQYWRAQSREIQAVPTDDTGAYHLHGLPPGDYLMIAVDDVDTGQWYDPAYLQQLRPQAKSITLAEGDQQTIDLTAPVHPLLFPSAPSAR
jgi:hypothetical protein